MRNLLSGGEAKGTTIVDWGWNILTQKGGIHIIESDKDIETAAGEV